MLLSYPDSVRMLPLNIGMRSALIVTNCRLVTGNPGFDSIITVKTPVQFTLALYTCINKQITTWYGKKRVFKATWNEYCRFTYYCCL